MNRLTDEQVEAMVRDDPEQVLRLLDGWGPDLGLGDLSDLAEEAGEIGDDAVGPLIKLLNHPSPGVREGAMYGLAWVWSRPACTAILGAKDYDSSPTIRLIAAELIGGWR